LQLANRNGITATASAIKVIGNLFIVFTFIVSFYSEDKDNEKNIHKEYNIPISTGDFPKIVVYCFRKEENHPTSTADGSFPLAMNLLQTPQIKISLKNEIFFKI
jgi:hypothetical protein